MTEILQNLAHQWRQPLSIITTATSGIKLKKDFDILDDKFLYDHLNLILNSSASLSKTIDELSYLFNPQKDKQNFCLANSINKTINFLEMKFQKHNILIETNLRKIKIMNYETELVQIFINLFNNSIDAFAETNIKNKVIKIDIFEKDEFYQIDIQDNAGGIKKDHINRIFEPYFTSKHKSNGTGLSLYMSEQILTKYMNGKFNYVNNHFLYKNEATYGALFSIMLLKDGK